MPTIFPSILPEGEPDPEPPFHCGVNDCSREVTDPDATCWQHSND